MNWQVVYPVTVTNKQLREAFLSADSVQNVIAKIIEELSKTN